MRIVRIRLLLFVWGKIDHELMRARITHTAHGVFDTFRFHTHREDVLAIVARRFRYIETQKVLAFQILFNRLKNRRQIGRLRRERGCSVANDKIFSASLLCKFLKAFRWASNFELSVTWLEER